ncbi:MAG: glycosyltransferase family 4 protein [Salinivirgaceae bacterium]|nr:glycosyltransferase family 4 protein [Salinivirgaceae bacterium]
MKVIHLVANKTWGGGEQYVYDIVEHLKLNGESPVVVCRAIPILVDNYLALGVPVYKLKLGGYFDFKSVLALLQIVKNIDDDCIIHAHDFKRAFIAVVACKMYHGKKKIRVIMTRHLIRQAKKSFLENMVYKNISAIVFVSELARKVFMSSSPMIEQNICKVIYSGVKDRACDKNYLRNVLNIADNEFVMMYHGRIEAEKGVEVIIEALSALGESISYRMVFIGDDTTEYVKKLKRRIENTGLKNKIIWTGYQKNIGQWIGGCNLGLVPTIAKEAFGLSVVEYMMAGKTVITTDNGAQKEYIQNGVTGVLIYPSDSQLLAKNIEDIYNTKDYVRIGNNAREYYEKNLSYDVFFNKMLKMYRTAF